MKFRSTYPTLIQRATRLSAAAALTVTIAACGGGTSGGTEDGGSMDPDIDNGTGNEITPLLGSYPVSADDLDGDGLYLSEEELLGTDPNLADSDGNGIEDSAEDFDNDDVSNLQEFLNGTDPLVADGDGTAIQQIDSPCTDFDSEDSSWGNNCQLQRFGTYARSSYTQGMQRIVWCHGAGRSGEFDAFADGILGPITDEGIRSYQAAEGLVADGIVGPGTWDSLRDELILIDTFQGFDTYGVAGCINFGTQFFQLTDGAEFLGWKMARSAGSSEQVSFSSGAPH